MGKIVKLLKNISIFGISQFASKILVFVLLPFYTSYLSTSEFGNSDLVFSTVSLLIPLFTMEISSAVLRFTIEKKENATRYFHTGLFIILTGFALLLLLYPVFVLLHLFTGYLYLFYLLYLSNTIYLLFSNYARAVDKIKAVGICGVFNTVVIVSCNILFLAVFRMGIYGYLLSYISGYVSASLLLAFFVRKHISMRGFRVHKDTCRDMARYSLPLAPNNVAWWGVSSANKFVVRSFLNDAMLGLYSAALRIPSMITVVQSIISEGLVLSVLDQYDAKNPDNRFYSLLYKVYSTFSIFVAAFIIVFSKLISSILFAAEFSGAWVYVPFLCISPLWGSLSGFLGTFYAAAKKTKGMFVSTILGAAISLTVSIVGIRFVGIYSIIFGNIVAYFCIWLYRWIDVKKTVSLRVNLIRDAICWVLLIGLAAIVVFMESQLLSIALSVVIVAALFALNFGVIHQILQMMLSALKGKKKAESTAENEDEEQPENKEQPEG